MRKFHGKGIVNVQDDVQESRGCGRIAGVTACVAHGGVRSRPEPAQVLDVHPGVTQGLQGSKEGAQ